MTNKSSEGKGICCLKCSGYFEHRIGSHSDDRGGDSDYPCYCNQNDCKNPDCECHNQKLLDKKKTKEWKQFLIDMGWDKPHTFTLEKQRVKSLLDKQRTELLEGILNLECLKEEKLIDDTKVDCMILEKTWEDNDLKVIRNQLRKEIIDEINKL